MGCICNESRVDGAEEKICRQFKKKIGKKVDENICQFKISTRRKLSHWCLQKKDSRIQILGIQVSMIEDKESLNNEIRNFEDTCP